VIATSLLLPFDLYVPFDLYELVHRPSVWKAAGNIENLPRGSIKMKCGGTASAQAC
jgi:hypothetical protein